MKLIPYTPFLAISIFNQYICSENKPIFSVHEKNTRCY